jgi:ketosteroid isomerase-like protein
MTRPVDTVRRFYDPPGNGDVPAVLTLLDPQVEWGPCKGWGSRYPG